MRSDLLLLSYLQSKALRRVKDRNCLLSWQERALHRQLQRVRANFPWYARHWQACSNEDWKTFPLTDRQSVMDNFAELNRPGFSRELAEELCNDPFPARRSELEKYSVGMSSGTSGQRGLFIVSKKEQALWAGNILAKVLPGPLWQPARIALFLRSNNAMYETVGRGNIRFRYFNLAADVEANLGELARFEPTILVAPPSMLRLIAQGSKIRPEKIVSCAEVLEELDCSFLSNAFQKPVEQIYQCTEGFLAASCQSGRIHLNEDLTFFELESLPDHHQTAIPVITDLVRFTQPLVRYRLPDILTLDSDQCECGSAMQSIKTIQGRLEDCFVLKKEDSTTRVHLLPAEVASVFSFLRDIDSPAQYEIVQLSESEIQVSLPATIAGQQIQSQIQSQFTTLCVQRSCVVPRMSFQRLEQRQDHTVKLRRVRVQAHQKFALV